MTVTDPHDGSRRSTSNARSIALLAEQLVTRREFLERVGALGAARARTQLLAACGAPAAAPRRRRGTDARRADRAHRAGATAPRRHGRADAGAGARGRAERLQLARLHRRGRHRVVRGEVPGQGQLRAVRRHLRRLREARRRRQRLRPVVPDLGRHARLHPRPARSSSSTTRCSRTSSTSAPSGPNPGYDPGNQYSVPYVWWTTGIGYDTTKVDGSPDELQRALGSALRRATSR